MNFKLKLPMGLRWVLGIPLLLVLAGCLSGAGESAPPLSIPAPVTGRITVSSPDDQGQIAVIGEDNAVDANALVLAINTSNAVALLNLFDRLIPNAYAQTFPERCTFLGHACTFADANGAFEILLPGDEDDDIEIVVIDSINGDDLGTRIVKRVPANFMHFLDIPIDITVDSLGGFLYVLLRDPADTATGSRIVRVDLTTGARESNGIDGVDPQCLKFDSDMNVLTALDRGGQMATIADLGGGGFSAASTVNLPAPPVDAALDTNGFELWVTLNDTTDAIAILDTTARVVSDVIAAPVLPGWSHQGSLAIDSRNISGSEVMGVVSEFSRDADGVVRWGVSFYDMATRNLVSGPTIISDSGLITDIAFFQDDQFMLLDNPGSAIMGLTIPGLGVSEVSDLPRVTADPAGIIKEPVQAVIVHDLMMAFVSARNGDETHPDTVMSIDMNTLSVVDVTPVGLRPSRMHWDPNAMELFVVSRISRSVTRLPAAILQPGSTNLF